MKKAVLSFVVILFACTLVVSAQPAGKKFELGFSGSFTSFKFSYESDSTTVFNLPLRAGYYIWKGLEIEPELMLTKAEGADAGFILAANLAYNFNLKGNLRPFVLAGIGFGNGFTVANIAEGDSDVNATVVNLGLGVKYLIGNSAALRLEYRYTHDHMKYDYVIEAITIQQAESGTENVNSHQILAGVSIFF